MKYAIIRIKKAMTQFSNSTSNGCRIMCDCYEIAYHGFKTLEAAQEAKIRRSNPDDYIIIQYWE